VTTSSTTGHQPDVAALSVLAVDDEPPALDELAFLLRADALVGEVRTAADATDALRVLRSGESSTPVDVVFLDIRMPGLDGLELARVLSAFADPPTVVFVSAHDDRAVDAYEVGAVDYLLKPLSAKRLARVLSAFADPPTVVFVSAHDDRAVDAYEVGAVDYLLKPLSAKRLAESLRRIQARRTGAPSAEAPSGEGVREDVIAVELGGTTTLVPRSAVRWVEAQGDYARLHTLTGSHLVRIPLSVLEDRWRDAGFLRVHRSYLVALPLVTELQMTATGYVVRLDQRGAHGAVELPVSRRHTRELKDRLVRTVKQNRTAQ
jgi:two-component system response regulator LytT